MITPTTSFKENLAALPSIEGIARIDLVSASGNVVAQIDNVPGKQGSLAVYNYLKAQFGALDVSAAQHGLEIFGEHTEDAKNRPGAHPNIDRLLEIVSGANVLNIVVVPSA